MDLQTSKRCEWNTTSSDLHRSKRTLSNFDEEILLIIEKFIKVDYPLRFINSVNNEFQKGADHKHDNLIISPDLLELLNRSYPWNI